MDQSKRFLLKSTLAWPCTLFWQADAHSQASEIVVSTQQGKLRGYRERNVCVFKGIPYGNVRASANRLGAPLSPSNWTGIRDAACYGPAAPQIAGGSGQSAELFFPGTDDTTDENCLVLNVWTRNADRACRRPVLVWLHGGNWSRGFGSGSLYDSTDFVGRHDTVNVTLNHRLNALGYLNVSHLGDDRFLDSGCAGMLDIIAALGWVKENIQDFGGDPDNVTIFGQSGGGYKISALLAMEQARGLFHKAIIQSGPQLQLASAENGSLFADRILSKLELRGSSADSLIDVPAEKFVAAYASVYSEIATNGGIEEIVKFRGPILDGRNIHIEPFSDTALEWARDVPLLIGTTACE
jgi:para-nitrobenzyl esterase